MFEMHLFVGTFSFPYIYTLFFDPHAGHLNVTQANQAIGGHHWLSLAADQKTLYAATYEPWRAAAYKVRREDGALALLNSQPVARQPGYVTVSKTQLYSVGGLSGEVFPLQGDGSIGCLSQTLTFAKEKNGTDPGIRYGAHGVELSPDGKTLYVPDIGSDGVWTFAVSAKSLTDQKFHPAVRKDDGSRHAWLHPNGKILYVIQEHSGMVDVFRVDRLPDGKVEKLEHLQGASVLPRGRNASNYWADEIRLSTGPPNSPPKYLFTSTRGLEDNVKGYVAAFELDSQGSMKSTDPLDIWETPTSGGWANAIEPAPWVASPDAPFLQYLALTDDYAGTVRILTFDGTKIRDICAVTLEVPAADRDRFNGTVRAATAVWLRPN